MNFREFLSESKIYNFEDKIDLNDGTMFAVVKIKHALGSMDPYSMVIVDDKFNIIKRIGTHPSLDGAMKYGQYHYGKMAA